MTPLIFAYAAGSSAVTALLGSAPVRFFEFGEAEEQKPATPYAVWQTVYGTPENLLNETPRADSWGVQVDSYAKTSSQARAVAKALRDAVEPHGYVVSWNGESHELDTRLYRYSFTVEFLDAREESTST